MKQQKVNYEKFLCLNFSGSQAKQLNGDTSLIMGRKDQSKSINLNIFNKLKRKLKKNFKSSEWEESRTLAAKKVGFYTYFLNTC